MAFADNLKTLMGAHQVSQQELAGILGISAQGVYQLASGRNGPSLNTAGNVARVFGVTIDSLVHGSQAQVLREAAESFDEAKRLFWEVNAGQSKPAKKQRATKSHS
jgi:transcriptional regulator with XRE-family HTH domain